jgi:hypothetical protein
MMPAPVMEFPESASRIEFFDARPDIRRKKYYRKTLFLPATETPRKPHR